MGGSGSKPARFDAPALGVAPFDPPLPPVRTRGGDGDLVRRGSGRDGGGAAGRTRVGETHSVPRCQTGAGCRARCGGRRPPSFPGFRHPCRPRRRPGQVHGSGRRPVRARRALRVRARRRAKVRAAGVAAPPRPARQPVPAGHVRGRAPGGMRAGRGQGVRGARGRVLQACGWGGRRRDGGLSRPGLTRPPSFLSSAWPRVAVRGPRAHAAPPRARAALNPSSLTHAALAADPPTMIWLIGCGVGGGQSERGVRGT